MNLIALICSALVLFTFVNCQIVKVSVEEFQNDQISNIANFNKEKTESGFKMVEFDNKLMSLAQNEAERLAKLGRLEYSVFNLNQKYYGFSYKITGRLGRRHGKILIVNFKNLDFILKFLNFYFILRRYSSIN